MRFDRSLTALSQIAEELIYQQEKYPLTEKQYYEQGELMDAAHFALTLKGWPENWNPEAGERIAQRPASERIVIAAAFLAREIERRGLLTQNEPS